MGNAEDPDDGPHKIPPPGVIAGKLRRAAQDIEDRDNGIVGGVGRRPRTAPLEHAGGGTPIEAPEDITDVHKLVERVLDGEEFTPSQVRLVAAVMDATWKHVNSAERRRMNGDLAVAAVNGDEQTGRRLTDLETRSLVISGENGSNGRLGNLRGEVRTLRAALIAVALAVLGGAGASAKALYTAGESRGSERAEFIRMQQAIEILSERQDQIRLRMFGIPPAPAGLPGVIP